MSNLSPLSLPRFHVNALTQTHKDKTLPAQAQPTEGGFEVPDQDVALEAESEEEQDQVIEPAAAPMLPEIDTGAILNRLEAALEGLERTALAHSQQLVAEFLRAAFPNLCESLLAPEITRATSEMAPNEIDRLTVTIPTAFEASFQRAIQASPKMAEICDLQTHGDGEQIIVDVDWRAGGLQFNMDQFLESSLGRLNGSTQAQEGQDV